MQTIIDKSPLTLRLNNSSMSQDTEVMRNIDNFIAQLSGNLADVLLSFE